MDLAETEVTRIATQKSLTMNTQAEGTQEEPRIGIGGMDNARRKKNLAEDSDPCQPNR